MKTATFNIRTRVAKNFHDDNRYTTSASCFKSTQGLIICKFSMNQILLTVRPLINTDIFLYI